jgi:hypothetical protein
MIRTTVLLFLLTMAVSCRSEYQPQALETVDPGPPDRVLPSIRVLDAGMTPRVPLRYRVAPGQTEVLYLEMVRVRAMRAEEQAAEGAVPPVQLEVKVGPAEPTPEGFIRHPVQITQVRLSRMAEQLSPAQREEMERMLAPLLQLQGWSEMDLQGQVRRAEFRGLDDVPPTLRTMLGNIRTALLTVPFPDEPVGVRARWEVERKLQLHGVWVDQVVTYDIERMDDKQLALQITARQSAAPQAIEGGRLEAYQASLIGSSVVRLEHFTPFSEGEATSQMRITVPTETGPKLVRMETGTAVRLYPAEAAQALGAEEAQEPTEDPDAAK